MKKMRVHLVRRSLSGVSHHGLHPCPPLFLLLAPLHVFQVLPSFAERLQEGVEDAEEVVRLHPPFFFSKVLQRFGKLQREMLDFKIKMNAQTESCEIIQIFQNKPNSHTYSMYALQNKLWYVKFIFLNAAGTHTS